MLHSRKFDLTVLLTLQYTFSIDESYTDLYRVYIDRTRTTYHTHSPRILTGKLSSDKQLGALRMRIGGLRLEKEPHKGIQTAV